MEHKHKLRRACRAAGAGPASIRRATITRTLEEASRGLPNLTPKPHGLVFCRGLGAAAAAGYGAAGQAAQQRVGTGPGATKGCEGTQWRARACGRLGCRGTRAGALAQHPPAAAAWTAHDHQDGVAAAGYGGWQGHVKVSWSAHCREGPATAPPALQGNTARKVDCRPHSPDCLANLAGETTLQQHGRQGVLGAAPSCRVPPLNHLPP